MKTKTKLPKKLLDMLNEIEEDCIELRKKKQLTERGFGQWDLILLINDKF